MTYQDELDAKAAAVLEQLKEDPGSLRKDVAGVGVAVLVYVLCAVALGFFAAFVLSPASLALDARPWFQQKVILFSGVAAIAAIFLLVLRRR